jgi:hypothetical protein
MEISTPPQYVEVKRSEIKGKEYKQIFKSEPHKHVLLKDENGSIRWKANPTVRKLVDEVGLNGIMSLFYSLGLTKNSEIVRKMYRDMGYSLYGYWEIFYFEMNNDDAADYKYSEII